MRFSIIIPTFNSESTIERCIESVLRQTFKDFEILVMDGASSDSTMEIVRHLDDERLAFSSEKDKGVYDAMNKGITKSRGEWLYFLGSDDALFDPDVLRNVSDAIDKALAANVIYGNVKLVNAENPTINTKIYGGSFTTSKLFIQNICHQSMFYKAAFVREIGFYDLSYPILADYDFNLKAWKKGSFKFIDLIIAEFSLGGMSSSKPDARFAADRVNNIVKYFYGFRPGSIAGLMGKGVVKCQIVMQKIKNKLNRMTINMF